MLTSRNYDVTLKMSWLLLEPSSVKIGSFGGDLKRKYIKHACLQGYVYNFTNKAQDSSVYHAYRYVDFSVYVIVPRLWVF